MFNFVCRMQDLDMKFLIVYAFNNNRVNQTTNYNIDIDY